MKKMLLGAIALMLLSFQANAINLQFKFDIFSSGTDIYACNAGLKHETHKERVCFERGSLKSCQPESCKDGEACNCVCTGGFGNNRDGEFRLDYFTATYRSWDENTTPFTAVSSKNVPAGKSVYNTLFEDGNTKLKNYTEAYRKQLASLQFNLGSERYGSEYFVDVCFRASQITYPSNVTLLNLLKRYVTITDLGHNGSHVDDFNGSNAPIYSEEYYQDLSGLEVRSYLLCKDKDNKVLVNAKTKWQDFSYGQMRNFSDWSTKADLKKCVVRYAFREGNRNGQDSVRRWKLQHAQVCTYTSVNEAE